MKKNFVKTFFLLLSCCSLLYADPSQQPFSPLVPGVYQLEGSNPGSERINYVGEVEIRSHGSNYTLTWKIGNSQTQTGIGILKDHVLSVAYYDLSGRGSGVVSFRLISPNQLEGSWAGYGTTSFGREWLTFKH